MPQLPVLFSAVAFAVLAGISCTSIATFLDGVSKDDVAAPDENLGVVLHQYLAEREATPDTSGAYLPHVALLPFSDDSGFKHDLWTVENEIPGLLTVHMEEKSHWRLVPYAVVLDAIATTGSRPLNNEEACDVGQLLKADFVGRGTVIDYDLARLQIGDVMIGGYKSFKGTAELEVTLVRVRTRTTLSPVHALREVLDRGLGFDLLGRPRKQDLEFAALRRMEFGSEDFLTTALGQATVEAFTSIVDGLDALISPSGVKIEGEGARILSVEGEEIFINLGSKNGLHQGYRFRVLPGRSRALNEALDPASAIATVEVSDIIGGRLSRVQRIGGGEEDIVAGDRLQFIELPE